MIEIDFKNRIVCNDCLEKPILRFLFSKCYLQSCSKCAEKLISQIELAILNNIKNGD